MLSRVTGPKRKHQPWAQATAASTVHANGRATIARPKGVEVQS